MTPSRLDRARAFVQSTGLGFLFLTGAFTAAYFLTGALYAWTGWQPAPLVAQVVTSLVGLLLAFVVVGIAVTIARRRGWSPEGQAIDALRKALQQIARGDFNVRVTHTFGSDQPLGELAESVNAMAQQLGEMEQMRQAFISDVSHEIQSPLTSIHGFAEALRQNHVSPEQQAQYLDIILSESARLERITDNLLRLAALESDHPRFEPQLYRLDKQIRDLILACEPQWTAKGIALDVRMESVSITADADLLSQVWINLLGNAIKFTPDGGKICVDLDRRDDQITFRIADSGIGIAAEDQPRLFERFYKADKARSEAGGGSGLGLAIAKKIVEMHSGTIGVESAPGAGATFRVTLSVAPPAADPAGATRRLAPAR